MRFHNLQLLRVAAAVGVVLFHLGVHGGGLFPPGTDPGLVEALRTGPWAMFPVPVFFALSGFVLTHALQTAPRGRFLVARFLRLYPGYWLAVLLGLAYVRYGVWPPDQAAWAKVSTTALALVPAGAGKGYYVLGGVEWSLIYEVMLSVALTALSVFGVRRGLPVAVGAWLAVLAAKVWLWPGYATDPFPRWQTVLLSAYSVPFLLGVLVYYLRDVGRRWRWPVAAAVAAYFWLLPGWATTQEGAWVAYGAGSAAVVWVAVQVKQVAATNPLAKLGDATYGLYLVHVPVILAVYYGSVLRRWEMPPAQVVFVAGGLALAVGLLYGKLESALHARLRPLARVKIGDVWNWVIPFSRDAKRSAGPPRSASRLNLRSNRPEHRGE